MTKTSAITKLFYLVFLIDTRSYCEDIESVIGQEIDYTAIAGEAEKHKDDILSFLDQSNVMETYKTHYQCLLDKLLKDFKTRRGPGSTRRIVSGYNTSIVAVPWQVSLREKTYPICGGTVVSSLWCLTAAHCLMRACGDVRETMEHILCECDVLATKRMSLLGNAYPKPEEYRFLPLSGITALIDHFFKEARANELSVRLGSSWKNHGGEMYDVKECFVHPRYISKTKVNDVGLVHLYTPLRFSARVLPIKIVGKNTRLAANVSAIVSGWGKLKENGPSATYLQSSTIKTISMKLCRRSGLDRKAIEPGSMFCAGSFMQSSPDACQGDSGGPIVHDGVIIGVVSWGLGCARGNFPGVYTRLSNAVIWDWVHQHISQLRNTTTS